MSFAQKIRGNLAESEQVFDLLRTARCQLLLRNFSGCVDSCVKGFEVIRSDTEIRENNDSKRQVESKVTLSKN